jgi:ribosomal protein S18 acetylase RimI-like enzyme
VDAQGAVRRLGPGDYDALCALWRAAGLPIKPEGRDSRAEYERQLSLPHVAFFGRFQDGRLVAAVLATHDGRKGWVNRLAVHPDFRRRHLALELIRVCEAWFVECGVGIFACLIEAGNDASRAVFAAAGYETFPGVTYHTKRLFPGV